VTSDNHFITVSRTGELARSTAGEGASAFVRWILCRIQLPSETPH
jgi:hypothetical protein